MFHVEHLDMTVFTAFSRFQSRLSDTSSTLKFDPYGLAHLYLKSAANGEDQVVPTTKRNLVVGSL